MIYKSILNYLFPILAYLLGSISPAKLIAGSRKISLEEKGQNPGTAGIYRTFGIWAAVAVLIIDVTKGLLPVIAARLLNLSEWTVIAAAILAVAGHNWPIYHRFRGGGGLATSIPLIAYLLPREFMIAFPIAVIAGFIQRWIPFGGIVGLPVMVVLALLFREPTHLVVFILVLSIIILIRRLGFLLIFLKKRLGMNSSKEQEKF
jgi:glycerol-3-phosphate acyltransferase PlsY